MKTSLHKTKRFKTEGRVLSCNKDTIKAVTLHNLITLKNDNHYNFKCGDYIEILYDESKQTEIRFIKRSLLKYNDNCCIKKEYHGDTQKISVKHSDLRRNTMSKTCTCAGYVTRAATLNTILKEGGKDTHIYTLYITENEGGYTDNNTGKRVEREPTWHEINQFINEKKINELRWLKNHKGIMPGTLIMGVTFDFVQRKEPAPKGSQNQNPRYVWKQNLNPDCLTRMVIGKRSESWIEKETTHGIRHIGYDGNTPASFLSENYTMPQVIQAVQSSMANFEKKKVEMKTIQYAGGPCYGGIHIQRPETWEYDPVYESHDGTTQRTGLFMQDIYNMSDDMWIRRPGIEWTKKKELYDIQIINLMYFAAKEDGNIRKAYQLQVDPRFINYTKPGECGINYQTGELNPKRFLSTPGSFTPPAGNTGIPPANLQTPPAGNTGIPPANLQTPPAYIPSGNDDNIDMDDIPYGV
jgi:uncharacterized cysteine cluster protein YcgN (CxxCxxCC family)